MAMSLGPVGRKEIQVGGAAVPTSAFANLGGVLAAKAFAKAEISADPSESLPDYLYTDGKLSIDPGIPSQRAARLLEMLGEASMSAPRPHGRATSISSGASFYEADAYYDELDLAELDRAELDFIELDGEGDQDEDYDD